MQALLNKSTCVTGITRVAAGKCCSPVSVFPANNMRSRRSVSRMAALQDDKQVLLVCDDREVLLRTNALIRVSLGACVQTSQPTFNPSSTHRRTKATLASTSLSQSRSLRARMERTTAMERTSKQVSHLRRPLANFHLSSRSNLGVYTCSSRSIPRPDSS